jgi:hypothetical protein
MPDWMHESHFLLITNLNRVHRQPIVGLYHFVHDHVDPVLFISIYKLIIN